MCIVHVSMEGNTLYGPLSKEFFGHCVVLQQRQVLWRSDTLVCWNVRKEQIIFHDCKPIQFFLMFCVGRTELTQHKLAKEICNVCWNLVLDSGMAWLSVVVVLVADSKEKLFTVSFMDGIFLWVRRGQPYA